MHVCLDLNPIETKITKHRTKGKLHQKCFEVIMKCKKTTGLDKHQNLDNITKYYKMTKL